MATRMATSHNKSFRRFSAALSSAFLEWMLMLLLFVDAFYSFFVTKFARLCKLPVPCPFCSRLDHVLGDEKPRFYRDLICKTHKSEISQLGFCSTHQKLANARSMCEACRSSFITDEGANTGTHQSLAGQLSMGIGHDADVYLGDVKMTANERICSCCSRIFEQKSQITSLFRSKIGRVEPAEIGVALSSSTEHINTQDQLNTSSEPEDTCHLSSQGVDRVTRDGYDALKTTSDSETEAPFAEDGQTNSPTHEAGDLKEVLHEGITLEKLETPDPDTLGQSKLIIEKELHVSECHDVSLASPIADDHPLDELSLSQIETKDDPAQSKPASEDPQIAVSEDRHTKDILKEDHVSQIASNSRGKLSHTIEATADPIMTSAEPATRDPHNVVSRDSHTKDNLEEHASQIAIKSTRELSQAIDADDECPKTNEPTGDPGASLSTQMSLSEAYKLAIGSKSSLPSPTLTDVILGNDSSGTVHEELRLLISQLSAARGLESPWNDIGPSPRAQGHGADLVVQNITKSISIERHESGLESLDGSIVSEIEGESIIDRLKRQIDLDRKSISLLCKELEEERNASAIAASQALAMITRLQDEKAAVQMEALQYQRMMEEQTEYDQEALQKSNELLAQREQRIQELEAELESYRRHFGGERRAENEAEGDSAATNTCDDEALSVPHKTVPTSMNSLSGFEDDKAYITNCLRKLEKKLHLYSNNSTSADLSSSYAREDEISKEMSVVKDNAKSVEIDWSPSQEGLNVGDESRGAHLDSNGQSSATTGTGDLSTVQEEITSLNSRLQMLEADHNFLEHSINSLRNGAEGLQFVQEIACDLRELRAIGIKRK